MAFRPRRQSRKEKLLRAGFLPFESHTLSEVSNTKTGYYRKMVKDRRREYRQWQRKAELAGWSRTRFEEEYQLFIKNKYLDNKWMISKVPITRKKTVGRADPWGMLKDYRQKDIDSGEYRKAAKKRRREEGLDKGKVLEQKARYRERKRTERLGGKPYG